MGREGVAAEISQGRSPLLLVLAASGDLQLRVQAQAENSQEDRGESGHCVGEVAADAAVAQNIQSGTAWEAPCC